MGFKIQAIAHLRAHQIYYLIRLLLCVFQCVLLDILVKMEHVHQIVFMDLLILSVKFVKQTVQ